MIQRSFNAQPHFIPIQSPQPCSERRNGNGPNIVFLYDLYQINQPAFNIFNTAFSPPMTFGRKIDNPPWQYQLSCFKSKHFPRLYDFLFTRLLIRLEILRIFIFKLQRDTTPHNTNTIYGIHQGFGITLKNIASFKFNHDQSLQYKASFAWNFNILSGYTRDSFNPALIYPAVSTF